MLLKLKNKSVGSVLVGTSVPLWVLSLRIPLQVFKVKVWAKPLLAGRVGAKVTILKYSLSFSYDKSLSSGKTTIPQPYLTWRKHNYSTATHCPSYLETQRKEEEKKKTKKCFWRSQPWNWVPLKSEIQSIMAVGYIQETCKTQAPFKSLEKYKHTGKEANKETRGNWFLCHIRLWKY